MFFLSPNLPIFDLKNQSKIFVKLRAEKLFEPKIGQRINISFFAVYASKIAILRFIALLLLLARFMPPI